ncbi:MAG TPA: molybdopterin-dependent oxidoreductase, partial [Candidatus Limnocylindrales bacterium]|nr:molybdopterin-dependent oxidoreductase [Candidatus Limnocylindrales bacterium]
SMLPGAASLIASVGQVVIDLQPPGAKDLVVALFGTNDKLALELFVSGSGVGFGALLGLVARSRFALASAGFGAFGLLGVAASLGDPVASPAMTATSAGLAVLLGVRTLGWLLKARSREAIQAVAEMPDWSRRVLLRRVAIGGAAAVAMGVVGHLLIRGQRTAPVGSTGDLPTAAEPALSLPPGTDLAPAVPRLSPIVTPNSGFYLIDTALLTPAVDTATWTLRIHGLVEREATLTWDELTSLPLFEQYVTIACVSNEVGGDLVGNAKWTGVRLREVLDIAGVQPAATQLVGRSVDGWTAGMPTAWVMDPSREPMIAIGMNDEPLPVPHGYPARLIVPGLYGYVSAT